MKRSRLVKKIIAISMACLISGIGFPVSLVFALPQGGVIISGQGSINLPTAQDLVVNQNTSNLIINWQGFNIGASESVQFIQPSINSVALNRVIGIDPSIIAGRLSANGQVFITNPSGVIFLPGSRVDVHGLLATTLDISDQDFLNRTYRFTQNPNRNLASILNEGTINASYVGLLAPSVVNRGNIFANLGSVALASGKAATMDFSGDNLINFVITEEVEGTGTDADGNVLDYNISNEGLIRADGGIVSLSVRRAGEIVKAVINQEGIIEARTVVNKEGRIFLSGGDNGVVSVTGTLDASGKGAGEKGGTIHVTGENVGLFDFAKLDASGDIGGGEILIGGDRLGEGELQNAKATFVGEDVSINADAITEGDGGKVVIFAEDSAKIYGDLSARGGSVSGNGGFVETSGKQYFEILKTPEVGAPNGLGGEWLIDPFDVRITLANLAGFVGISPFLPSANFSTLPVGLILDALTGGVNVFVTTGGSGGQPGNLIWDANAPLNFNGTGSNNLTLFSNGDLTFNGSIFDANGVVDSLNLIFTALGNMNINGGISNQGSILFQAGLEFNINSGNVVSGNNPIVVSFDTISIATTLNSGQAPINLLQSSVTNNFFVLNTAVDNIQASGLVIGNGQTGSVSFDGATFGAAQGFPVIFFVGGDFTFTGAPSTFFDVTIFAFQNINVNADVLVNTGNFAAIADADQSGAGDFNLDVGNSVIANFVPNQNITVTAQNFNVNGALIASGTVTLNGVPGGGGGPPVIPPVLPPVIPPIVINLGPPSSTDLGPGGTTPPADQGTLAAQFLANAQQPGPC